MLGLEKILVLCKKAQTWGDGDFALVYTLERFKICCYRHPLSVVCHPYLLSSHVSTLVHCIIAVYSHYITFFNVHYYAFTVCVIY